MEVLDNQWKCEIIKAQNGFVVRYPREYSDSDNYQITEQVFELDETLENEEDDAGLKKAFISMCWWMNEHFAVQLSAKRKKYVLNMEVKEEPIDED